MLTVAVTHGLTESWDSTVLREAVASRTPYLTRVAVVLGWAGLPGVVVLWAGSAAFALDRHYQTWSRCLLRVLAVLALDIVVVFLVKNVVSRLRPPSQLRLVSVSTSSFPSGHATATTAAVSMLLVCLAALSASRRAPVWALAAGVVLVAAVGWSRIYLGVHHPSDVVAGTLLGVWLTLSTTWLMDAVNRRQNST